MMSPLDMPLVQDKIVEFIGPKYARNMRLVNHAWNKKAVAVLADNGWTVRVTPENVDEYCDSKLLRPSSPALTGRMKISLDFGDHTTAEQFHHLIDSVMDQLLAKDGPNCVKRLKFGGAALSFRTTPEEFTKLFNVVQFLSPGLRALHLVDGIWSPPGSSGPFVPLDLSLPNLREVAYSFEPQNWRLVTWQLLNPRIMPQLSKLRIGTATHDKQASIRSGLALEDIVTQLKDFSQLTELSLSLDTGATMYLSHMAKPLPTVVHLHLHFHKCTNPDFKSYGPLGTFISHMCPKLRTLDLEYEPQSAEVYPGLIKWFPDAIGPLASLHSLTYRKKNSRNDGRRDGNRWPTEPLQLLVTEPQLLRDNFSNLQSVTVQLDFEMFVPSQTDNGEQQFPLQFLNVRSLKIYIPAKEVWKPDVLERLASNLHGMYPNVSFIAIDLEKVVEIPIVITASRVLIKQFRSGALLEKFTLVNCELEIEPSAILWEVIGDSDARTAAKLETKANGEYRVYFNQIQ